MTQVSTCLNCGENIAKKFCPNCGQKSEIHRLSLLHFLTHDIIHGFWHIDKGILFTVKELFIRPGFAAQDYIKGKRVKYFSFFTLLLLVIGAVLFANHYLDSDREFVVITNSGKRLDTEIVSNLKFILLAYIPILAFVSLVFFRRLKLWFSEHLVANTFFFSGILILYIVSYLFSHLIIEKSYWFESFKIILPAFYLCICYYQFTYNSYSFWGFLWRMIASLFFFFILFATLFIIVYNAYDINSFSFVDKI